MIKERELDLLIDLLKLQKKYGNETFASLAHYLLGSEPFGELSEMLVDVSEKAKAIPKEEKKLTPTQEQHIPKALVALKHSEPEKFELLFRFHNDLVARTVLPTLRDIKDLAEDLGLPEIRADSRQKAISPFITSLAAYQLDKIKARIQSIMRQQTGDRHLEDWAKIILNKKEK
jgi:hypothetical protein